jgi:hypothetical protein
MLAGQFQPPVEIGPGVRLGQFGPTQPSRDAQLVLYRREGES